MIKELAENIGNGFRHATDEMGNGFKSQKGYNARLDSFITRIDEHNRRIDEHNLRLEKILEKLAEK